MGVDLKKLDVYVNVLKKNKKNLWNIAKHGKANVFETFIIGSNPVIPKMFNLILKQNLYLKIPIINLYYINNQVNLYINIKYLNIISFFFKLHQLLKINILSTITCVDFPDKNERFTLIYTFLSVKYIQIYNLHIKIPEFICVHSLSVLFKNAIWLEREIWDLFGIYFLNNFDLRRLLTDYGFPYHPFRKTFPIVGFLEVHYDILYKKIIYQNIILSQKMKIFNHINNWLTLKI